MLWNKICSIFDILNPIDMNIFKLKPNPKIKVTSNGGFYIKSEDIFSDREKSKKQIDTLKKEFEKVPEIQQCYYVTGESDFFLVVVVPSMSYYENLTRTIFFSNENIKKFRTVVVIGITKNSLELPLSLLLPSEK